MGERLGEQTGIRLRPVDTRILPLLDDSDPLGVEGFATHVVPLEEAPRAYATFQAKEDGMIKTLLRP